MAVTDTTGVSINNSNNNTVYTTASFTPAANDWLILFAAASDSVAGGVITDGQSLGWDTIVDQTFGTSRMFCFGAQTLAAASAMTITYTVASDAGTGCIMFVRRIAGGRAAASRFRQAGFASGAAASTPAVTMGLAMNTANAALGAVFNATNPATLTAPASWTEQLDTGHATPDMGGEYVNRLTGETGSTITWGLVSASAWGAIVVEAYEAAQPPAAAFAFRENVLKRRG